MAASMRPQQLRRTLRRCAAEAQNGTSETSPRISSPSQQLVIKVGAAGTWNPGVGAGHSPGCCPTTAAAAARRRRRLKPPPPASSALPCVLQQVNLVHQYFDVMLTEGNTSIIGEVLTKSVSHKDMVRNVGRVGLQVRACLRGWVGGWVGGCVKLGRGLGRGGLLRGKRLCA